MGRGDAGVSELEETDCSSSSLTAEGPKARLIVLFVRDKLDDSTGSKFLVLPLVCCMDLVAGPATLGLGVL